MTTATADDGPKLSRMKYQVTSVIGTSPRGTLLRVLDRSAGGSEYALRVIKREQEADDLPIDRARAEAESSRKLNHPSVLRSYDFRTRKSWFRVAKAEHLTEFVEGARGLDDVHDLKVGPLVLIFKEVAAALAHMHRRGVLHGDFQPGSVLLGRSGKVRVRGYGINAVADTFKEKVKPHANYVAPELPRTRAPDALSDVYSWAATFYHVAAGRPATSGLAGRREEGQKIPKPSVLNPKIPARLNNLLMSCLQTSPALRPASAYAVVKELEAIGSELGLDKKELGVMVSPED